MTEAILTAQDQQVVDRNGRWNFAVSLWDEIFIILGISLVSRETVMPALVSQLTDSKLAIGLIPAIFSLGMYLPQLLVANYSEQLRYKKPLVMLASGPGERGAYLLMALAIWWLAAPAPKLTLVLFFVLLAFSSACIGVAMPAWFDMIAKVIPMHRRGLLFGLGRGTGALLGVIGALFVGQILANVSYPNNFALVFAIGFVVMSISWFGLALTREPESVITKPQTPIWLYFRQLPAILRSNRNYRRFLLSRTIVQLGTLASGFYMVYGIERFAIDGAGVGQLTAALVGSTAVMNLFWGVIGDRLGHKTVLVCSAIALVFAALNAWAAPSAGWLFFSFILMGVYIGGDGVSSMNIILEFCRPEERPTYVGLTNTLLAPLLSLAPLLGGWLATIAGYHGLFLTAMSVAAAGACLLALWVREPRSVAPGVNDSDTAGETRV